ncbi:uncharacterized protein KGF55_001397 [Candida pseudojiufengensis]|uniref:uncharacterized protein n=1 Tax=Candida pseudojiufengensis TaxID=497109 RepID=UPI0022243D0A|nr:uncharacterized protein KGF55_001397 [Candida pseudojiufengensis]KAI5965177.1 hypothetical protein KGF55_001397 [Candida pseudojiufengensis]
MSDTNIDKKSSNQQNVSLNDNKSSLPTTSTSSLTDTANNVAIRPDLKDQPSSNKSSSSSLDQRPNYQNHHQQHHSQSSLNSSNYSQASQHQQQQHFHNYNQQQQQQQQQYNNYNGNSGYYYNNKNQYNNNSNKHYPNSRQGSFNQNTNPKYNNNQNNNQTGPGHRKSYSSSKMNYPHPQQDHQQQQQQSQQQQQQPYGNFVYGGTPMYAAYNYYPPMYVQPIPYTTQQTSQPYIPQQQPNGGASTGSTPQHQHQQLRTPPVARVKLTTKDGKPVDLEDKKKKTASSTPVASPFLKNASPAVNTTTPATETNKAPSSTGETNVPSSRSSNNSPVVTKETPTAKPGLSAAEEFKRKIRERAAAAAAAKEKQEKQEKPAEPAVKEQTKDETPQPKVEEPKKEEEIKKVEEPKPEENKSAPSTSLESNPVDEIEEKPSETSTVNEPKEESEIKEPIVEPKEEPKEEPREESKEELKEELKEETKKESTEEPKDEFEAKSQIKELQGSSEESKQEEQTIEPKETEDSTTSSTESTTSSAPEFNITQFLERLTKINTITDILSTTYPENIKGVDESKQIPSKKYRYDPQFLIQFREIVQYPIDSSFKTRYEFMDLSQQQQGGPGGFKRSGSTRDGGSIRNNLGGGQRQPSSMNTRFNAPHGGKGILGAQANFDNSRQNSRSGSKRRGTSSRDKSTRKGGAPSKRGANPREMREKTEEEIAKETKPVEEVKPLEKTANRWVPKSRQAKTEVRYAEDGSIILEKDDVERKIKSLLNKLTLEMFTAITDEMLSITKQSKWEKDAATIKQTISLTFQKACDEPYWSEMYAKFCAKMTQNILPEITDETSTLKDGTHPSGGALARRVLLATCQEEYEKGWSDKLPTNPDGSPLEPEMMSDEYYAMAAAKRRGLGLVKFIGHLYNLNMLNDQVIYVCLKDQCNNTIDPSEDSLENLAQLIKTVGPKLDSNERTKTMLKIVFDNIQIILDKVKLSSRIKFMLMDLQDLRKSKWSSGKSEAQPTTIEAIHRDAEINRLKLEKEKNKKRYASGSGGGGIGMNERSSSHYGRDRDSGFGSSSSHNQNQNFSSNNNNNNNAFFKKSPSFGRSNSNISGGLGVERSGSHHNSNFDKNTFTNVSNNNSTTDLQRDSSKRSENQQINRFAALDALDNDDDDDDDDDEEEEEDDEEEGEEEGEEEVEKAEVTEEQS